jgi:outer membrane protein assembly factor BamB
MIHALFLAATLLQPRELWHADIGKGHAAVAVAGDRVIAFGHTGSNDTVWCLAAGTGNVQWRFDYPAPLSLPKEPGMGAFGGPHAPPVIAGDRVFTLSRHGVVHCLELATGKPVWRREFAARLPECGLAGAPLVVGPTVYFNVGNHGVALDTRTGEPRWVSGNGMAGYAAPVLNGKDLLVFGAKALLAVGAADGQVRWRFPWPTHYGANCAPPVPVGDAIFLTTAYRRGSALVDAATGAVRWTNTVLNSQCSPVALVAGNVYGFDGYIDGPANDSALLCLDVATGTQRWRQPGMNGQLIAAGDRLVLLLTSGDLVMAEANPIAYREIGRTKLFKPFPCAAMPVLAGGRLYCRHPQGRLICLDAK